MSGESYLSGIFKYKYNNTKIIRRANKWKMESKARAHVVVKGRVQGVLFRYVTRDEANMRGIKGWVRNLSDGRVEAVFEGEKGKVDEIIEFCHYGPPAAKVSSVKVTREEYTGEFKEFFIRYR